MSENRQVYLHLLLSHQSVTEYKKIITIVDYIKNNIHLLTKDDIKNYTNNKYNLTDQEINIIYNFIKENYNSLLEQDTSSFEILKNQLNTSLYNDIINLYNKNKILSSLS